MYSNTVQSFVPSFSKIYLRDIVNNKKWLSHEIKTCLKMPMVQSEAVQFKEEGQTIQWPNEIGQKDQQ